MALSIFADGWDSYGMDWNNPDPYDPIYLQALQYAVWERLSVCDRQNKVTCPNKRSVLNYEAYVSLYNDVKKLLTYGVFIYKPGEEPDGVQTTYLPKTDTYSAYSYYIPFYVFCPISVKQTNGQFVSITDFLNFPSRGASKETWSTWLKCVKYIVSECKYVALSNYTFYTEDGVELADNYIHNRPRHSGNGTPGFAQENESTINTLVGVSAYTNINLGNLCAAWELADSSFESQLKVVDVVDSDLYLGRRNRTLYTGVGSALNYITISTEYHSNNASYSAFVAEHTICDDITYYRSNYASTWNWDTYKTTPRFTPYVLTGVPIVVYNIDMMQFIKETLHRPAYHLTYHPLGYPFVKDEWVALAPVDAAGVAEYSTEGFVAATQQGYNSSTFSYEYSRLPLPQQPTEANPYSYMHYGFCILGAYADFSEGFKFK